ncbi:hypothetical protein [Neolewinella litorea]|uniref:Glycosyl transferase family 28 C-terminal domain-containing protein n=1 Tax=Neolewinella litorea TaxID=2562452 RepID=A0A4S4NKH7_9BACT|nr:hypothetical protein [Neolewinella litorea]THH40374.1 hypothetical protein E4021_06465 [Neolewinella litorea]
MLPSPVGFYAHHHGAGHATRTRLLANALPRNVPVHVFTSATERFAGWERGQVHALPPDVTRGRDPALDLLQGQVLHYAPVDQPGVQQRMALLADWIARHRPSLFVVDLSVEVALFVRLCGVRTTLVRLHGRRDDPAHLAAFGLAERLIAPFPAALEDAHTPQWIREKTLYLGAFSRYDDRTEGRVECRMKLGLSVDERVVTVINGEGGGAREQGQWARIAEAVPEWTFLLVGQVMASGSEPGNLRAVGRQDDTFPYLRAADVVVGSGGTNTMFEIGAARTPYLSLPEPRPFDEQACKMRALERLGLTRIVDPKLSPTQWREALERARQQPVGEWDSLFAGRSLRDAAAELLAPKP